MRMTMSAFNVSRFPATHTDQDSVGYLQTVDPELKHVQLCARLIAAVVRRCQHTVHTANHDICAIRVLLSILNHLTNLPTINSN
jgi:hypothetical protein